MRAFDLADGERRWIYDAKTPFFAPVAVAGDVAYAGDLQGVIHAIDLADGTAKWKLDLGTDPMKAPGMIYGGPVFTAAGSTSPPATSKARMRPAADRGRVHWGEVDSPCSQGQEIMEDTDVAICILPAA